MDTYDIIKKLNIPLLKKIDKLFSKSKKLDKENEQLLELVDQISDQLGDYQVCAVGSIRQKLGLGVHYEEPYIKDRQNPNYCYTCTDIANRFPNPINEIYNAIERYNTRFRQWESDKQFKDNREYFKGLLVEFRLHLKNDHNVDLETVIKA